MLEEIKLSLELGSSNKDELLNSLIKRSSRQVMNWIQEQYLPEELEYIVIELVIARYNYIGSEGLSSENSDGVSLTYKDNLLDKYKEELNRWIEQNKSHLKKNRLRLL